MHKLAYNVTNDDGTLHYRLGTYEQPAEAMRTGCKHLTINIENVQKCL